VGRAAARRRRSSRSNRGAAAAGGASPTAPASEQAICAQAPRAPVAPPGSAVPRTRPPPRHRNLVGQTSLSPSRGAARGALARERPANPTTFPDLAIGPRRQPAEPASSGARRLARTSGGDPGAASARDSHDLSSLQSRSGSETGRTATASSTGRGEVLPPAARRGSGGARTARGRYNRPSARLRAAESGTRGIQHARHRRRE